MSMSRLASTSVDPYDWVKHPRFGSTPLVHTSSWISDRSAFHPASASSSIGASSPAPSTMRTHRSTATQAMTLECTKWRRGPRTSQIPSSGSRHTLRTCSTRNRARSQVSGKSSMPLARPVCSMSRVSP